MRSSGLLAIETVLAIGAHPDDIEIGLAGTLLAHRSAGHTIAMLVLSHGERGGRRVQRIAEANCAAGIIGAALFLEDLEDTRISPGQPTVGLIEQIIDAVRPTTIYTHSLNDTHQDHRATHQSVMVAARHIGRISCFQSPSATVDFRPNRFVPITRFLEEKQRVIRVYRSQTERCVYLRPDVISANAQYWSRFAFGDLAEALEVVRDSTALDQGGGGVARSCASLPAPGESLEALHVAR